MITDETKRLLLASQRNEITEYHVYKRLARATSNPVNQQAFATLADEERTHYERLKALTGTDIGPSYLRAFLFYAIARLTGFNFGVRVMERSEVSAQRAYHDLRGVDPRIDSLLHDEEKHEEMLVSMIDQEALSYSGSIVLGLNDALVELLGALAGLTLALGDTHLIAMVGLITGTAAAFSMAGSEYLSTLEEEQRSPMRASLYTGISYIFAVTMLIVPYFVFENAYVCLGIAVSVALVVMLAFTSYIAFVKDSPVKKRFLRMAAIGLGVALVNFGIGAAVKRFLGVEI